MMEFSSNKEWEVKRMGKLLDKLMLFILCSVVYLLSISYAYIVVPIIISVFLSALNSYFEHKSLKRFSFTLFIILCFFEPLLLFFIPLIAYDLILSGEQIILIASLIPIALSSHKFPIMVSIIILSFFAAGYFLKFRTINMEKIKTEYMKLRDNTKEFSISIENKNKELMEKQDYEVNLAMLHERNRIAREIHDNVGHLLSSSILQIGALLATVKDDNVKESLAYIKNTLSQWMDSIRNNIHDLHEESIDLYTEINTLVRNFTFCEISLDYDIESTLDKKLKYTFISIIKETLSNIIKHSNATKVIIIMREHPKLYQLVVKDNGTKQDYNIDSGIGIKNITDRITSFHGNINIHHDKGFTIFISVPKEFINESSTY